MYRSVWWQKAPKDFFSNLNSQAYALLIYGKFSGARLQLKASISPLLLPYWFLQLRDAEAWSFGKLIPGLACYNLAKIY